MAADADPIFPNVIDADAGASFVSELEARLGKLEGRRQAVARLVGINEAGADVLSMLSRIAAEEPVLAPLAVSLIQELREIDAEERVIAPLLEAAREAVSHGR